MEQNIYLADWRFSSDVPSFYTSYGVISHEDDLKLINQKLCSHIQKKVFWENADSQSN